MRKSSPSWETNFIYTEVFFGPWGKYLSMFCGRIQRTLLGHPSGSDCVLVAGDKLGHGIERLICGETSPASGTPPGVQHEVWPERQIETEARVDKLATDFWCVRPQERRPQRSWNNRTGLHIHQRKRRRQRRPRRIHQTTIYTKGGPERWTGRRIHPKMLHKCSMPPRPQNKEFERNSLNFRPRLKPKPKPISPQKRAKLLDLSSGSQTLR